MLVFGVQQSDSLHIHILKKNFFKFIYFWLCWVFSAALGLSPVLVSGGYSLVVVPWLLIAVTSLLVKHDL